MPDGRTIYPVPSLPHPTGRRGPFGSLMANSRAEAFRQHDRAGVASHAVPAAGAPLPETLFADGRTRVDLGRNNYPGLAGDPQIIGAAVAALRRYDTSSSGSRVLNGTTRLHLTLEEELGDHARTEAAVLTSSGINANLAVLSTTGAPGDVLLVDTHAHASVHAAAAASRATVVRFRHNSLESLVSRLERLDPAAGLVVVIDGVYSMTGETAPLAELAELRDRWSARLVVDEAHGFGVGATGRGAAEAAGVDGRVDATTIAVSKSLASVGGAVQTPGAVTDGVRASALRYVFSAANDPAAVAAAPAALRVLRREPERMGRLRANGDLLRRVLTEAGPRPPPCPAAAPRWPCRRGTTTPPWPRGVPPIGPGSTPTPSATRRCRGAPVCCGCPSWRPTRKNSSGGPARCSRRPCGSPGRRPRAESVA
ncbi:Aminotransferase class I and II [Modestobacter sp. DSM 44400]|uniref:aminotransferase class I/II-fold pyridoxal phosphate-dependent enzyme n=1 Tax=Modestobacter sp. DSM 44400 TaxID=1550230 RepID=UPI000896B2CA|nr:aminotransferase class I/II-fold pyridoxal phosphate-dependent enzyme [Modestobacter sp. DSM 44400]SDX55075.1 Aminotransferase class I and II [Modestobacter sp. DSM 44400]